MSTKTVSPQRVTEAGRKGEVRDTGSISNDLQAPEKWSARLRKAHGKETRLYTCYEAGPCGFGIARRLRQLGVECEVVAPSMTPTRSGGPGSLGGVTPFPSARQLLPFATH